MYSSKENVFVCVSICGILACLEGYCHFIYDVNRCKSSACSLLNIVADDEHMYQKIDNIIKILESISCFEISWVLLLIFCFLIKNVSHTEYLVRGLSQVSFHSIDVLIYKSLNVDLNDKYSTYNILMIYTNYLER